MACGWIQNSVFCLLLFITCSEPSNLTHSNSSQKCLLHLLKKGYEKELRPVRDWKHITTVHIDVTMYSILAVDEKNQLLTIYFLYNRYWVDEFLKWNPLEFDNMTIISIPVENIWIPDILIKEFVDAGNSFHHTFVYINHEGKVNYQKPIRMSVICMFNIYFFPFDTHNCSLSFQSQLHTIEHINVSLRRTAEEMKKDLQKFYNHGEWELVHVHSTYRLVTEKGNTFARLIFHIIFTRNPLYYMMHLILPSIFLMIIDIVGFYIPPESGERVSFKITLFLGYSVFLIIVSETLPPSVYGTPIIDVYFLVCMTLLVISLAESIFIVQVVNKKKLHSRVPKWVKKLVLEKMSIMLCMKDKDQYFESNMKITDTFQEIDNSSTAELIRFTKNGEDSKRSSAVMPIKVCNEILESIYNEIVTIRQYVEKTNNQKASKEWLLVGHVLDTFLFWMYLVTVMTYTVILTIFWSYHIIV